ncbi:hypothetical protein SBBP2_10005 [Burkholderiales bacterium]|nr:hypothetical protein SBBP2_10005 [Burkholderiales bacterium]
MSQAIGLRLALIECLFRRAASDQTGIARISRGDVIAPAAPFSPGIRLYTVGGAGAAFDNPN